MKITDLYQEVAGYTTITPEYKAKMLHKIPETKVVDRAAYLVKAAEGRVLLDLGASGPMSDVLRDRAKEYHAVGIEPANGRENYWQVDLDWDDVLPEIPGLELMIAGEVLEHLSNAGHFLSLLHNEGAPVILTVPNAFTTAGRQYLKKNVECVNKEHVAWYSYHTLKVLVERHCFKLVEWYWYNGKPITAEGLIFCLEPE